MKTTYTVAAAVAAALAGGPALAQEQTLEEIVVTAQKREQNVQDVPIAISAFSGDMLQSKSIGDIGALTRFAPNVNLDTGSPFSGDTSVLSASIRGIVLGRPRRKPSPRRRHRPGSMLLERS